MSDVILPDADADGLRRAIGTLARGLIVYGQHRDNCAAWKTDDADERRPCSCGLSGLLDWVNETL